MCGIFGHCTNRPGKINQSNVKILGLFNETRGKHSCGITYDGEIYHGLEKDKLFTDFIKGKTFKPQENPLMFGHTRSASVGAAINEHNAHPFGFGTNKTGGYKFIGVHNGTLYNHLELAKDYGIDTKATYKGPHTGVELERTKIDSEILLEILHTDRTYKVLSEYIGKAALVWTDTDAPNVTYFWSGQSRMTETYIHGPEMEERPMNIWIENRNSFYFSSLPESLEAIGAPKEDVFQIEYNTVYQVTNGDFKHAHLTKVSRKQCFQTESYVAKHTNYANHFNTGKHMGGSESTTSINDEYCDYDYSQRFIKPVTPGASATLNEEVKTNTTPLNIFEDRPAFNVNEYRGRVYSYKLRYWLNGHLISGIYCNIPTYGFYKLGSTQDCARKDFDSNRGKRFFEGHFHQDPTILTGYVPFTKELSIPVFYYFLDGVMLETALDYEVIKADQSVLRDIPKLSHASKHPIIDTNFSHRIETKQEIYKDGKLFTGSAYCVGFERTYHIVNGNLVKVTNKTNLITNSTTIPVSPSTKKEESTTPIILPEIGVKHNPTILSQSITAIMEIEEEVVKKEALADKAIEAIDKDISKTTKSIITDMIDLEITPCLMSFQNCREELNLLPAQDSDVIEAKSLVNDVIQTINKFVN